MKKIFIVGIFLIAVIISLILLIRKNPQIEITSFEECSKKYPIMESYPASCATPDGKRFTQNIGNELALSDSIQIVSPRPNQSVGQTFVIQGNARGFWFFEGQMSAELRDVQNNVLGNAILTADGEWMTEEFVPFSGLLKFTHNNNLKNGVLYIQGANPSGLEENNKELIVPVVFQ